MDIVRSPTQIRDGRAASAHLRAPTDPIASLLLALAAHTVSVLFQTCLYLIRYPPAARPLPHHASPAIVDRIPRSKAGSRPKQNARPSRRCALMSVSLATQDRQPTHHCHPARRHWLSRVPARCSIILNSYFHNQGQSPDDDLRVQLARPPSAPQRPNHATQNPPRFPW